ncbi:hypothetical protein AAKU52_002983 [Pedobacter sp. CG_S7]|uniref:type IX secretion system outer membrane channel protein PorV n=1 Tax=Pedobacter sp. CG_S7 TaxID=3143930 RepID=UPI003399E580
MYFKGSVTIVTILLFLSILTAPLKAQVVAVPFLLNSPDARTGALGDAGVALSPDANSLSNNPSKLPFLEQAYGFSVSYNPWLKNLVSDINLGYLSAFYKLSDRNTIGASIRYFSLGEVPMIDINQQNIGLYSPNEFAIDATFARKYSDAFSLATSIRYIQSNIASGQFISGKEIKAGTALAVDIAAYYKQETYLLGKDAIFALGATISNIGTKLSYMKGTPTYFLPANIKIGTATTFFMEEHSQISFALDVNKLLVPGTIDFSNVAEDISVPAGIFGSLSDAPGGFKEEIKELNLGTGLEYFYKQQFALRGGFCYAHPQKGNKSYFTAGAGFKSDLWGLDIAYLMTNQDKSPLANSLRLTLLFHFNSN